MFGTIFTGSEIGVAEFLMCLVVSVLLGAAAAAIHAWRNSCSRNFLITLILLPAIVQTVIMLVNGNLGTGVAVMGAFSLVRFRSLPGNSREIAGVFLAMAIGLATGMGYLGVAVLLTVVIGLVTVLLLSIPWQEAGEDQRELKVTIPENLDYTDIFDDIFQEYTKEAKLLKVKTVNMGSLYELIYHIQLKEPVAEKTMLDEIRTRNGNLEIVCGRVAERSEAL